jgi:hypothetical protein
VRVSPPMGGARLARTTKADGVGAPRSPDRRGPVPGMIIKTGKCASDRITRVGWASGASTPAAAVVQSAQPSPSRDTCHQGLPRRPGDSSPNKRRLAGREQVASA